jgi:hypothetical protein
MNALDLVVVCFVTAILQDRPVTNLELQYVVEKPSAPILDPRQHKLGDVVS